MRELKFRAWDNLKKEWLKKKVYHFNPHFNAEGIGEFRLPQHPQGYTIQQYTGLKDKNGKEIYEGDIVQYNVGSSYENMSFIVQWSDDSLGYILQSQSGDVLTNSWTPNGNRFNFIELKGNIFENSELLK